MPSFRPIIASNSLCGMPEQGSGDAALLHEASPPLPPFLNPASRPRAPPSAVQALRNALFGTGLALDWLRRFTSIAAHENGPGASARGGDVAVKERLRENQKEAIR